MRERTCTSVLIVALVAASLLAARRAGAQQELGHKTLGTLGLKAGAQPGAGVYLVDAFVSYRANEVFDRNGHSIPVGLDLDAIAGVFGAAAVVPLPIPALFYTAAASVPGAHVSVSTTRPEASIDRFGLGDLYVQPVKLGWRTTHLDVVTSYAFYAPTGSSEPGGIGGVGRGQWTYEASFGGAVYLDDARSWHLSALASYDWNSRKLHVDVTRGDTFQIQGGAGATLLGFLDVGVAAYSLWQVQDDTGTDLPALLAGARDRAYGVGPEVDVALPPLRSRLAARYEQDFAVESRPRGEVLFVSLVAMAWGEARR